jgi:NADH:ubiquinone oxidoreductase subunit E
MKEYFKDKLLLSLLVLAQEIAPRELTELLLRFGFRSGDISYRRSRRHTHLLANVERWPWEPRRDCTVCGTTVCRSLGEQAHCAHHKIV